ncbi:ABC transporter permease [Edaphobacter sp. 4G125]|nr:ABC transporter permease [Edaphobacter sp. 4G125]
MSPKEARVAARRAYGGVEQAKQLHRDERSYPWLAQTLQDIRHTLRQLRKSPGFTLTAILMLGLGIGATTAIFSIVEGVLLRPLPFPEPGRLVTLGDVLEGSNSSSGSAAVTAPDIRNYMRDTHSFTHLGGYQQRSYELSGSDEPQPVRASRMSGEVFSALEVAPLLGRVFTQQEDDQHQPFVVLSYSLWQGRFHGDAKILGSKILLNRNPYIVIGVMPRDFEFPLSPGLGYQSELWVPMSPDPGEFLAGAAASWNLRMVGRLKPGVTPEQAQSDAQRVAIETMRNYPAYMSSLRIHAEVKGLQEDTVARARPLLRTLFFAVVVVLLIACANQAGLLLVRSIRRRREIAVRLALGARATALLRQAVIESMILSLGGGVLGLAFAGIALRVGLNLLPQTLPRVREIGLDWVVVSFALGLVLLTGFLCGLAPAFAAIQTSVNETLKEGGRTGSSGSGHTRLRSTLVVGEIAVALILLAASGLLLRSFEKMRSVDMGFQPDHTLAAYYSLPGKQYTTQPQIDTFNQMLLDGLRQLPGVESVGMTGLLPAGGFNGGGISILPEGYVSSKGAGLHMAASTQVKGDLFPALGIRLLRGRLFTEADREGSPLVAIVNHKLAEHYWPGENPIGKRLRRGMPETSTPWMTIVGEVGDVKMGSADGQTPEQFYQPATQVVASEGVFAAAGELMANYGWVVLRTSVPPEQMENSMRAVVQKIDPQLAFIKMKTLDAVVSDSEAPRRFNTVLISSFAIAAVLLGVMGIYSVIAFTVAIREQEMAIRMALGCERSRILQLVLASGAKLAAVGCVLGLLGAIAVSSLLRSFLFGVSPFDPAVLGTSVVAMLLLALMASLLPALRASMTDPMLAVRGD